MAKTCPSCGYSPIGPFTDNCPICAEPVRNVRSNPAGSALPGGMPLWLRWVLGVATAVVLGVAGCCGLGMLRMGSAIKDAQEMMKKAQAKAEEDRKARTVVVTAADLLQEFKHDPAAADRKYQGKNLEVSGIVERRGKGGDGASFVILNAGDESAQLKIECFFNCADEEDEVRSKRLSKGQEVTVRGEYAGRVSHVQVRGCVLVK